MIKYAHFRVPKVLKGRDEGPPMPVHLYRYSRQDGWIGDRLPPLYEMEIGVHPNGGATVCWVEDEEGKAWYAGLSLCSFSDNFNYALGRRIARNRMESAMNGKTPKLWMDINTYLDLFLALQILPPIDAKEK